MQKRKAKDGRRRCFNTSEEASDSQIHLFKFNQLTPTQIQVRNEVNKVQKSKERIKRYFNLNQDQQQNQQLSIKVFD